MGSRDYLKLGDYNAACDICGFKFKASELKKNWKGQWCCKPDWEPRNEQEFLKLYPDQRELPYTRPPIDSFTTVDYVIPIGCSPQGQTAVAGIAVAGCSICGTNL